MSNTAQSETRQPGARKLFAWIQNLLGMIGLVSLILIGIQFLPLRATPTGGNQDAEVAIILGFGFEGTEKSIEPGISNEFLLWWTLQEYPQVTTIFVQEGTWVVYCASENPEPACTFEIGSRKVTLQRIHTHNVEIDVNTLETAVCTIERMNALGVKEAVLVAHDLQLWRAAKDFERAKQELCPHCEFTIPNVPDTPYPSNTAQWRTQNEFIYRFVELGARIRDIYLTSEFECPESVRIQ